jgi:hypothetical protein
MEKILIKFHNTRNPNFGYNVTEGGDGISGFSMSEATKQKISDSKKGCSA